MLFACCSQHLSLTGCRRGGRNGCSTVCPRGNEKSVTQMKNPSVLSDTGPRVSLLCRFLFTRSSYSTSVLVAGQPQWCKSRGKGVMPLSLSPLHRRRSPPGPASFPLFLLFVAGCFAGIPVPIVGRVVQKHLVESFESLGEVVLEGGERCTDGRRAEAVCDEGEVGEAALDARLQDRGGS